MLFGTLFLLASTAINLNCARPALVQTEKGQESDILLGQRFFAPNITLDHDVEDNDVKLFTDAVKLLNSSPLTQYQKDVIAALQNIHLYYHAPWEESRSGVNLRTGVFRANVDEFRGYGYGAAWAASQIAHEAFHYHRELQDRFQRGNRLNEEILALEFQIDVGKAVGLSERLIDLLNRYKDDPAAVPDWLTACP
jgi:hypothetical protein